MTTLPQQIGYMQCISLTVTSSRYKTLKATVPGASRTASGCLLYGILARNAPGDGGWEHWKTVLYRTLTNMVIVSSIIPTNRGKSRLWGESRVILLNF